MVHIVGAGPGDPELITVKGRRYLEEADVVIYAGSLVNPALLAPVLKAAAVGLLTQLTESFCKDAGQQALAKAVELGGGVLALYALLPLASSVAELLQRMAGGG